MTVAQFTFILGLLIGIAIGWAWRSLQFARDQDCANPDHEDNNIPKI